MIFSEALFREVFRVLQAYAADLSHRSRKPTAMLSQRAELQALLGREDANRVMAALDDRFTNLAMFGKRQGLTADQLFFVYEVISDSEAQMVKGFQLSQRNRNGGVAMIRKASEARQERLAGYLGDDMATALMKVFSRAEPLTAVQ